LTRQESQALAHNDHAQARNGGRNPNEHSNNINMHDAKITVTEVGGGVRAGRAGLGALQPPPHISMNYKLSPEKKVSIIDDIRLPSVHVTGEHTM